MSNDRYEKLLEKRCAHMGLLLQELIESEWRCVLRELDGLAPQPGCREYAACLIGRYQMLNKLMEALSEGSLSSDYHIEAQWRSKLIARVIDSFELDLNTPAPPPRYKSLAQQVAEACGLEVIQE